MKKPLFINLLIAGILIMLVIIGCTSSPEIKTYIGKITSIQYDEQLRETHITFEDGITITVVGTNHYLIIGKMYKINVNYCFWPTKTIGQIEYIKLIN